MAVTGSWLKAWRAIGLIALPLLVAAAVLASQAASAQGAAWESSHSWSDLSPAQREALKPLKQDWPGIDGPRRQKWIELASRFGSMSPEERARTQQRMADWVRLSPKERNEARVNFQGARQLSTQERQDRWEAYKALPEDQRRRLATQGKANNAPAGAAKSDAKAAGPKVNIVSNPFLDAGKPRAVATPGVVQAKPGATTLPIAARPSPPLHQQPGLPKVAATPEFVDSTTLLPQRGAQGAAVEPRRK